MHDPGVGWNDAEVLERLLAPAKERVALAIPGELEPCVEIGRVPLGEVIHLDGMIDDELDWLQRVDLARVAAQPDDSVAHGGKVNDRRNAGEILEQHPRRGERDFLLLLRGDVPCGKRSNVVRIHEARIFAPKQILEKDFQRVGQSCNRGKPGLFELRKAEEVQTLPA